LTWEPRLAAIEKTNKIALGINRREARLRQLNLMAMTLEHGNED
jgi:hypothetical protein